MVLFHYADPANRESISRLGLKTSFSKAIETGIFFTDTYSKREGLDCWKANLKVLEVEEDWTTNPFGDEKWFVCYHDVPAERLIQDPFK